jgi:predicted nucleic acid-binding Zn ribbon protein
MERIANLVNAFAHRHKLRRGLEAADVCTRAAQIVGEVAHVRSYKRKILTLIVADHKAAFTIRENEPRLLAQLNQACGVDSVKTLRIVVESTQNQEHRTEN